MSIDRKKLISEMRANRLTYAEIGRTLGISRQRACQINKNYYSTSSAITNRIRKRDQFRCQVCLKTFHNPVLDVHHINGIKSDNNDKNLISVCQKCHRKVEYQERPYNREKNGKRKKFTRKNYNYSLHNPPYRHTQISTI